MNTTLIGIPAVPNRGFAPYSVRSEGLHLQYRLPSGTHFLTGKPKEEVRFESGGYPQKGSVASVGWKFENDVPRFRIELLMVKIETPRLPDEVSPAEWISILREEQILIPPTPNETTKIVKDDLGRDWLEVVDSKAGHFIARAYAKPISASILLLVRLNASESATDVEIDDALKLQRSVVASVNVETRR